MFRCLASYMRFWCLHIKMLMSGKIHFSFYSQKKYLHPLCLTAGFQLLNVIQRKTGLWGPEDADDASALKLREISRRRVCVIVRAVGFIKWSAVLCFVTAEWALASLSVSRGPLRPNSGLSWRTASLSPSNYSWIFRCIHYLSWPGSCVRGRTRESRGLLLHWPDCRGVSCVCVGVCVHRGSCFSPAVGCVQYWWDLWGSVFCAAALRRP